MKSIVRKLLRIDYGRAMPASFWALYAYSQYSTLTQLISEQDWLLIARSLASLSFTLIVVILFIFRYSRKGNRAKPFEAFIAITGSFAPIFLAIQPITFPQPGILLAGNLIVLAGMIWTIISVAALGRCFGVFPEARGLVTRGPYRFVRHPVYLGEITAFIGLLLPALSYLSLAIFIAGTFLQLLRAKYEEKALEIEFPEYADYKTRTYRLIPYLW